MKKSNSVPEGMQCDANSEKVCPLKFALGTTQQVLEECDMDRLAEDYQNAVTEATKSLSVLDRGRFTDMLDATGAVETTLKPGTCHAPSRPFIFGKMSCNAATILTIRQTSETQNQQQPAPNYLDAA